VFGIIESLSGNLEVYDQEKQDKLITITPGNFYKGVQITKVLQIH
jgi:hypothetical protein